MKSFVALLFFLCISLGAQDKETKKIGFNPDADPAKELQAAMKQAAKEKKNILVDVGGEWCIWCHRLHEFIEGNTEIKTFIEKNYVFLRVNYSKENKNEKFLAKYPKVAGYPHLFVLNKKGKLLHSQDTGLLEKEKSYDGDKIMEFLKQWTVKK